MRLVILIERPKTRNPFSMIWPGMLWLWHKIRGREVYFSKPARAEINDDGDLEIGEKIEIDGNLKTGLSPNDTVRIINNAKEWRK